VLGYRFERKLPGILRINPSLSLIANECLGSLETGLSQNSCPSSNFVNVCYWGLVPQIVGYSPKIWIRSVPSIAPPHLAEEQAPPT
jgi:hypothetical protein